MVDFPKTGHNRNVLYECVKNHNQGSDLPQFEATGLLLKITSASSR